MSSGDDRPNFNDRLYQGHGNAVRTRFEAGQAAIAGMF